MSDTQSGSPRAYKQELKRDLSLWENTSLVVSATTPATGAFIIAPVLFGLNGTGAAMTFCIAAVLGLSLAYCWAELGSAYPIAGGDYTFIARILGRAPGFVSMFITGPVQAVLIPAVVALGMAEYLRVIVDVDANVLGAVIIIGGAVIALFGVRLNAIAVTVLLVVEILAVVLVAAFGFINVQRPITTLLHPEVMDAQGIASPLTLSALIAGIAVGSFAYNGFQGALIFSEETVGARRNVARAVFIALGVAVACEVFPVAAATLAAPSLSELSNSANPWQYVLTAIGGDTFNTVISLGIAVAVLNAVIALMPYYARILYSTGRDVAWPVPISRALAVVHSKYGTPWLATILVGIGGAVMILLSDVATLTTWTGALLAVEFILVAASALVSRLRNPGLERPYRMPLWPLWPIVAIVMSIAVLSQQVRADLIVAGACVLIALTYYVLYLRPRSETHFLMLAPPDEDLRDSTVEVAR
ncbi:MULTISPECIES: APC family permease [unclassified Mycolicibacterium]|uniref:APC family permease n=1 Tax=unclassified Mycolicibacterium TaxID=2636767 RepID=UPI0012DD687C|nr:MULTISPECIES: APC family permease [unclassified Mycolicibacterium]MUL85055.1 APC family permease [Mycolicibacterium sp. CBMA 329]MUL91022.1 APC family permease [Mycolicibacterium sp. CBMA 331]MUL98307.1 APC family permease [Mycolicibacterium sp. CBMA 334]MUM29084.1 APC family permease [Mycolicibacterium sp. CBMA 295]MUM40781.1 APC family permease [Mycolicibacterium sp. CBMA 247]